MNNETKKKNLDKKNIDMNNAGVVKKYKYI